MFVELHAVTVCVLHRAWGQLPHKAVFTISHNLRQSQSADCNNVQCSTSTPTVNAHHSSWTNQPLSETRPASHHIPSVTPQAASSCDNVAGVGQWLCIVTHRWQRKAGLRVKCYHIGGVHQGSTSRVKRVNGSRNVPPLYHPTAMREYTNHAGSSFQPIAWIWTIYSLDMIQ
jgi:hypothetical protein